MVLQSLIQFQVSVLSIPFEECHLYLVFQCRKIALTSMQL